VREGSESGCCAYRKARTPQLESVRGGESQAASFSAQRSCIAWSSSGWTWCPPSTSKVTCRGALKLPPSRRSGFVARPVTAHSRLHPVVGPPSSGDSLVREAEACEPGPTGGSGFAGPPAHQTANSWEGS
jgi:hypothetical protein